MLGAQASCLLAPLTTSIVQAVQAGKMPAAPVQARCLRSQRRTPSAAVLHIGPAPQPFDLGNRP
jgi:hypothetical protein